MLFVICNQRKMKLLVSCNLMVLCCLYTVLIDHPSFVNLLTSKIDKPDYAEWNHPYQLDQSICVLRVVGWYFLFLVLTVFYLINHYYIRSGSDSKL